MNKVVCIAASGMFFVTTADGIGVMRQHVESAESSLQRSQGLKQGENAVGVSSEGKDETSRSFARAGYLSGDFAPFDDDYSSFLLEQSLIKLHEKAVKRREEGNNASVTPQVQASSVSVSAPVHVSAAQPNIVKQQPAQVSTAVKSVLSNNNASKTADLSNHAADGIKSLWQNVSPIIRYPIEASISGISHLYSVNKPAAFAAGLGLAGTAVFLSWAGNKCLTNYGGLFCNPFRSPSFSERAAQFFGL